MNDNTLQLLDATNCLGHGTLNGKPSAPNYTSVRYNALKHGVLAKLTVLPHEDRTEFEALFAALTEEHQPLGPTELHLVEDLAAIMWRKRRVLLAENAEINSGLRRVVDFSSHPAKAAVPFASGMPEKPSNWEELMRATPEAVAQWHEDAKKYVQKIDRVRFLLRKGGSEVYDRAIKALSPEDREIWAEWIEDEEYQATAEDLLAYIEKHLWPYAVHLERETQHHFAIKNQAIGEGIRPAYLQNLCRYETHLDRKFERTLAMLIKLKAMRGGAQG